MGVKRVGTCSLNLRNTAVRLSSTISVVGSDTMRAHLWITPLARLLEALMQAKKTPHVSGVHLQVRPERLQQS